MKYPEIIMHTLCEIKPCKGEQFLDDLFCDTLKQYIEDYPEKWINFVEEIWEINQNLLIQSICRIYK